MRNEDSEEQGKIVVSIHNIPGKQWVKLIQGVQSSPAWERQACKRRLKHGHSMGRRKPA